MGEEIISSERKSMITSLQTPENNIHEGLGNSGCHTPIKRTGKAIVLVDIENLIWDHYRGGFTHGDVRLVHDMIVARVGHLQPDQVIGVCHRYAQPVIDGWGNGWGSHYDIRQKSGKDGADRALLDAYRELSRKYRYDTVVIGSGDGIFFDLAQQLKEAGTRVITLYGRGNIAQKLELVSDIALNLNVPAPLKRAA